MLGEDKKNKIIRMLFVWKIKPKHWDSSLNCHKIKILSQNIATVNCTVAYTVTEFQNLAHCNGSGQTVAMQMSQSDNFLVVKV
jgi:hypothetical protein